jgi:hypothetical protein
VTEVVVNWHEERCGTVESRENRVNGACLVLILNGDDPNVTRKLVLGVADSAVGNKVSQNCRAVTYHRTASEVKKKSTSFTVNFGSEKEIGPGVWQCLVTCLHEARLTA